MLTYEDCVGLCDLTNEEVEAIAEHDHVPNIIAAELGAYLVHTEGGVQVIHRMIFEDIEHARKRGDIKRTAKLKLVLKHFVETHSELSQFRLQIIGVLHGDITSREDAPKNFDESERVGTLEIYPEYQAGLDGIVSGQTIVVLFWLHKSTRDNLKVYPRGDKSKGLRGIFATRSPIRPNPIAISELKVLAIHGNHLEVSGLDILDGTPIIDIKKKISR